ncbi:MAG: L-histidine N(alpha)-methyltransferase [Actinomycetota bacterium]|nr:L-histidine N(alpha)-methyltransferase [Actinomycetota bacterium]
MTQIRSTVSIDSRLEVDDEDALAFDVLDGFARAFKELPPKYFYDAEGSRLFEEICKQPEYYPTRTERGILERHAEEIVALTSASELVELGSGVPTKTRLLLDAMAAAGTLDRYVPFDVSEGVVRASAEQLMEEYDGLRVHGIIGDYERHLDAVPPSEGSRIVVFLGGTIGNFLPGSRRRFLRSIARELGPDDRLLLGTDLVKDPAVLHAAYNDAAGVTAAFNLNVLAVLNRELAADFDLSAFEHVAFFDTEREWIEMRLRSRCEQRVSIERLETVVAFGAGEELRTELSAKFTHKRISADAAASGMRVERFFTDPDETFALSLCAPADGSAPATLESLKARTATAGSRRQRCLGGQLG